MLISKTDLYKTEWLDLVFDDRNKNYGAYELRQTYAGTMVKAMAITFFTIAVLCGTLFYINSGKVIERGIPVDNTPIVPPALPPAKEVHLPKPLPPVKAQPATPPVATTKFVTMVVRPDPESEEPPVITELKGAIDPVTTKGGPPAVNVPVADLPTGSQGEVVATEDVSVHDFRSVEVMPQPVGGAPAWAKFLSNNLRFPAEAQQDGVGGKVLLSFIIEKNGELSNIVVDRAAGHGFDEEALRVLKLAKAWKPGIQNGQPVRVKYSIPINFQAPE